MYLCLYKYKYLNKSMNYNIYNINLIKTYHLYC